jgi:hypothetical protein
MSRTTKAMLIYQRLERERVEQEARRRANSEELARPSTRKALSGKADLEAR